MLLRQKSNMKKIVFIAAIYLFPLVSLAHAGEEEVGKGEIIGPIVAIVVIVLAIILAKFIKRNKK